ncbi:hypothetical protein ACRALDRAFT_2064604, partial [Sodiomyces alcalophilus JCM 7366]|uniref:uncharacterized protein n=1 Tax=Sodiomyces alcalophilus JCM 7366 TaxID=591952 RepID=UPI0039B4A262
DHLVRIRAVALTNGELAWPEPLELTDPIPGYELAGTVIHAPPNSPFPPGTDVFARTDFHRRGSARPFSITTTPELSRKPANLSWEEAATVPLSVLTAWQALFVHGGLAAPDFGGVPGTAQDENRRKRVLVTAAAGGVGIWLVQLARLAGCHVIGTCGAANAEFVGRDLGAHEVLDYRNVNVADWVAEDPDGRGFDIAVDCVGSDTLKQVWSAARPSGKVISIVEEPAGVKPPRVAADVSSTFFIVEANRGQLEKITELLEAGACRAYYDSVFDLRDGAKAFERVQGRKLRGKVVL